MVVACSSLICKTVSHCKTELWLWYPHNWSWIRIKKHNMTGANWMSEGISVAQFSLWYNRKCIPIFINRAFWCVNGKHVSKIFQVNMTHLLHRGLNKMTAILQMTFSNAFSWKKPLVSWLKFHWNVLIEFYVSDMEDYRYVIYFLLHTVVSLILITKMSLLTRIFKHGSAANQSETRYENSCKSLNPC